MAEPYFMKLFQESIEKICDEDVFNNILCNLERNKPDDMKKSEETTQKDDGEAKYTFEDIQEMTKEYMDYLKNQSNRETRDSETQCNILGEKIDKYESHSTNNLNSCFNITNKLNQNDQMININTYSDNTSSSDTKQSTFTKFEVVNQVYKKENTDYLVSVFNDNNMEIDDDFIKNNKIEIATPVNQVNQVIPVITVDPVIPNKVNTVSKDKTNNDIDYYENPFTVEGTYNHNYLTIDGEDFHVDEEYLREQEKLFNSFLNSKK